MALLGYYTEEIQHYSYKSALSLATENYRRSLHTLLVLFSYNTDTLIHKEQILIFIFLAL